MKVVFPKNIKKGIFASMSFQIGPLTVTIIQLFILAMGIAISLGIFNSLSQSGSRTLGIIAAVPILIIFIVIAFFKVSDLGLIPFLAKLLKTYFFDTTVKYQVVFEKPDPIYLLIKKTQINQPTQQIQTKSSQRDKTLLTKIETDGLLSSKS